MDKYLPRIMDEELEEKMKSVGCIYIEGCKWCGKSTTAKRHVKTTTEFQDVDRKKEYDNINETKPSLFLLGEKPLLIDEWQMYPIVWDAIRNDVDKTGLLGQYIIAGSARPRKKNEDGTYTYNVTMHSGTGRIASVTMRPMSLCESNESTGKVSLSDLFNKSDVSVEDRNNLTFESLIDIIIRGGWPEVIANKNINSNDVVNAYIDRLSKEEIEEYGQVRVNPDRLKRILRSISRNISSPVNISTIYDDVKSNDDTISRETLENYISLLKRLYIVDNVPAWNGKIRSKVAIRIKEKLQIVDPSLAVASLGANHNSLMGDLNTLGLLFESLCIRDLKVYAERLGAMISYYRDETDLECDAILELQNGDWGAIEIKLGGEKINEAASNLLKLRDKIDTSKLGEPKFLMVLTGEDMSYRLDNGVYVVSIASLKD